MSYYPVSAYSLFHPNHASCISHPKNEVPSSISMFTQKTNLKSLTFCTNTPQHVICFLTTCYLLFKITQSYDKNLNRKINSVCKEFYKNKYERSLPIYTRKSGYNIAKQKHQHTHLESGIIFKMNKNYCNNAH